MRAWIETEVRYRTKEQSGSHAVCVRGLKLDYYSCTTWCRIVARRVRAWIETAITDARLTKIIVARRVRAWIETGKSIC